MDDMKNLRRQFGCRKCGGDIDFGVRYAVDGDFTVALCEDCRNRFAEEAPTLPWHLAWLDAIFLYEAACIRFQGRTDVSEEDAAAAIKAAWLRRAPAVIEARRQMTAWLDAEDKVAQTA